MEWQRAEGGHFHDLIVEPAQGASVPDADDGWSPGGGAQEGVKAWPRRLHREPRWLRPETGWPALGEGFWQYVVMSLLTAYC